MLTAAHRSVGSGLGAPCRDRGFSFIELLAYMAIAALLVLAAVPQFNAYRVKAHVSVLQSDASALGAAIEAYQLDHGTYPADGSLRSASGTATLPDGATFRLSTKTTGLDYHVTGDTFSFLLTDFTQASPYLVYFNSAKGGVQPLTKL